MQNEKLIYKNMLKYETDQLKRKPTAFIAKFTDTDAKTNDHRCKSNTHVLTKRQMVGREVSVEIVPSRKRNQNKEPTNQSAFTPSGNVPWINYKKN